MAEEQSIHRKQLEVKVIDSDINNSKTGLRFGLIIGIVALIASVIMAYFNAFVGGAVAILYIGSLVGTFVYGSQRKKTPPQDIKEDKE